MSSDEENSELTNDVLGYLQSSKLDHDTDYLRRGREFHNLADEEVRDRWCAAFQRMAETLSEHDRRIHADLDSELSLRSLDQPFDRVKQAFEKLMRATKSKYHELEQDPDAFLESSEQLQQDIDAFKAARDNPQS